MSTKHSLHNLGFFVIGAAFMILYVFFRADASAVWNNSVNRMDQFSTNSFNSTLAFFKNLSFPSFGSDDIKVAKEDNTPKTTKNCGTSGAVDAAKSSTYENNSALNCLGDSARTCTPAKGVFNDPTFPGNFEIVQGKNECNFKLSYAADSMLMDIEGKKLAGRYIQCPVSIVRSFTEEGGTPVFGEASVSNANKYAAEIYSYGTIGLFIENNLDHDAIEGKGCSGEYIDSILDSYKEAQANS